MLYCTFYVSRQAFYWQSLPLEERMFYLWRRISMQCPDYTVAESQKVG